MWLPSGVVGGWVTVVFILISLVGMVAIHLLPTGLNPLHHPVSEYHLTRYRPVVLIATLSAAVAAIGAIQVLSANLGSAANVSVVLLGVFVVARALIPFIRMDTPGAPVTPAGRMHNLLAFAAFGSAIALAFVAAGALHAAGFTVLGTWSQIFGVVGAVGALGILAGRTLQKPGLFGLWERLIYLGFTAWFLMIGGAALGVG